MLDDISTRRSPQKVVVVGIPLDEPLPDAAVYVGGRRQLASVGPLNAPTVTLGTDVDSALLQAKTIASGQLVCVLASGDPGFFGIGRAVARVFGMQNTIVRPAVSSVSLAFARLGMPWDDATVISCHGRPLDQAVRLCLQVSKAAVLTSPSTPPQSFAAALISAGADFDKVTVCSQLGLTEERVSTGGLTDIADGSWDPLSVMVLTSEDPMSNAAAKAWRSEPAFLLDDEAASSARFGADDFLHRGSMFTKPEVRSVVLGRLGLPASGVMWDVGAGSGSVGIEAGGLVPGLKVFSIERSPEDALRIEANSSSKKVPVSVQIGTAPEILADLPDPDRVFVGGGGISVLQACISRLKPGGIVVATFAAIDRAAQAAELLGNMEQITVSHGKRLPSGGWRLEAANPVFLVWGSPDSGQAKRIEGDEL